MIQGSERTISGVGLCHSIRVMQDDVMGLRDNVMIALLCYTTMRMITRIITRMIGFLVGWLVMTTTTTDGLV